MSSDPPPVLFLSGYRLAFNMFFLLSRWVFSEYRCGLCSFNSLLKLSWSYSFIRRLRTFLRMALSHSYGCVHHREYCGLVPLWAGVAPGSIFPLFLSGVLFLGMCLGRLPHMGFSWSEGVSPWFVKHPHYACCLSYLSILQFVLSAVTDLTCVLMILCRFLVLVRCPLRMVSDHGDWSCIFSLSVVVSWGSFVLELRLLSM